MQTNYSYQRQTNYSSGNVQQSVPSNPAILVNSGLTDR
jgi:hypothetical protein